MLALTGLLALATLSSAHTFGWAKGMYCRGGAIIDDDNNNTNDAVNPLFNLTLEDLWFQHDRGCDLVPPAEGDFLELPAGGVVDLENAHNRAFTTLSYGGQFATDWPDGANHPDDYNGNAFPPERCVEDGALHVSNESMATGTALAISYNPILADVNITNLVVFSVLPHTPWKRKASYPVPEHLPLCPPGGCHCAWLWVPSGCGQQNIYMGGYRCIVTGSNSTTPVAPAKPPVYCGDDQSKCTPGAKQMLIWKQFTGNNVDPPPGIAPGYNSDFGFMGGAQNDIFETSSPSPSTAPTTLRTATISLPSTSALTLMRSTAPVSSSTSLTTLRTSATSLPSSSAATLSTSSASLSPSRPCSFGTSTTALSSSTASTLTTVTAPLSSSTSSTSVSTSTAPSQSSTPSQVCTAGTGPGNYLGLCSFSCNFGYCPSPCTCTSTGSPIAAPPTTGGSGYPLPGEPDNYAGLCAFTCSHGYCPSGACTPNNPTPVSSSPPPASTTPASGGQVCIAGAGAGNYAGLCSFSCNFGYCPPGPCTCTAYGAPVPAPPTTGTNGRPLSGEDDSYLGLCSFACNHGYCPGGACTSG